MSLTLWFMALPVANIGILAESREHWAEALRTNPEALAVLKGRMFSQMVSGVVRGPPLELKVPVDNEHIRGVEESEKQVKQAQQVKQMKGETGNPGNKLRLQLSLRLAFPSVGT